MFSIGVAPCARATFLPEHHSGFPQYSIRYNGCLSQKAQGIDQNTPGELTCAFSFVLTLFPLSESQHGSRSDFTTISDRLLRNDQAGIAMSLRTFPLLQFSFFLKKQVFLHPPDDAWEDKLSPYRWHVSELPHHPEALTLYSWLYKHELRFFYNCIKQSVKELWGVLLHLAFKLWI